MRKRILFCLMVVTILSGTFNQIVLGDEYTEYKFTVYDLSKEEFLSLIESPKAEDIEKSSNYREFFSDRRRGVTTPAHIYGPHYNQYIDHEFVRTYEGLRLHATRIQQQLFDFCNEYERIEEVFADNDIQCKVLKVVPFSCNEFLSYCIEIPFTLFINTDVGDYFLTLNEFVMLNVEEIRKMKEGEYLLRLYTPKEYYNAFKLYDGEVYINDVKLEDDVIKFQAYDCYLPLRKVFEALGCTVEWDSETSSITISTGERSIVAVLEPDFHFSVEEYTMEFLQCFYEMENDRTVISRVELLRIRYALGFPLRGRYDKDKHILQLFNFEEDNNTDSIVDS